MTPALLTGLLVSILAVTSAIFIARSLRKWARSNDATETQPRISLRKIAWVEELETPTPRKVERTVDAHGIDAAKGQGVMP